MDFFVRYLKDRRRILMIQVVFAVVFVSVFAMYQLPVKAVLYPFLLCAVIGGLCLTWDFVRARKKHFVLTEVRDRGAAMLGGSDASIIEQDYQELIRSLQEEILSLESAAAARYQDMTDYYTVWVHQIKTPIASMKLTLQNEDTPLSRRLQGDLFRIEQYVEMVLTYLRLDSDTSDYVFKEYPIDTIIRQSVKKFSHEFIGRKLGLTYEPIEMTIVTDDKWLGFVLEQILSNALKYTRESGVQIYLAGQATLCIEDTGIGIAPEDLPRIFQKGYTGHNGRSDKRATGLGLYLCRRICKNLGIGIEAESEIGKGTVVKLNLEQYRLRKE